MAYSFPEQMRVGLVPMSAKPMQQGHYDLIELASKECDHVIVYVSTGDRKRSGEFPILGSDMLKIWHLYIENVLPENVDIEYVTSPVGSVFIQLGDENKRIVSGDDDVATYVLYAGEDDANANFPQKSLEKYSGLLFAANKIKISHVKRSPYSGTNMRKYLQFGEADKFKAELPDVLDKSSRDAIWQMLSQNVTTGKSSIRLRAKLSR